MTRDFNTNTGLPLESGGFMPTTQTTPFQGETWGEILLAANELFDTCVEARGMPGWASVTGNIIVAFWPKGSRIDRVYGAAVLGVGGGISSVVLNSTGFASQLVEERCEGRECG